MMMLEGFGKRYRLVACPNPTIVQKNHVSWTATLGAITTISACIRHDESFQAAAAFLT
jgi:hypothetical protein